MVPAATIYSAQSFAILSKGEFYKDTWLPFPANQFVNDFLTKFHEMLLDTYLYQRNLKQFLVQMHGNKIRNSSSEGFHSKPRITFFYCFHDFDNNSERLCQKSLIYLWLMLFYSNKASKLTPRKPFGIWRERGRCHLCLPAKTSKFDTSMSVWVGCNERVAYVAIALPPPAPAAARRLPLLLHCTKNFTLTITYFFRWDTMRNNSVKAI